HHLYDIEGCAYSPLRVVFVSVRVAKIGKDAVTKISGNEPSVGGRDFRASIPIDHDDRAQIFRVDLYRQGRGINQVAEHHRQLPALGHQVDLRTRRMRLRQLHSAVAAEILAFRIDYAASGAAHDCLLRKNYRADIRADSAPDVAAMTRCRARAIRCGGVRRSPRARWSAERLHTNHLVGSKWNQRMPLR